MKKTLKVLIPTALAVMSANQAMAGMSFDTPQGKLNIGGDVEFDVTSDNYLENKYTVSSLGSFPAGVADATDTQSLGGRIRLDVNGERVQDNETFTGFKLNPGYRPNGDVFLDDAWVTFGKKNDWSFKLGHFEAYDLSPAGQDTYVVQYGDAIYRAKDGRGRTSGSAGQFMVNKVMGPWYAEVSTMFGDDKGLYDEFENKKLVVKNKDPLLLRPVLAWNGERLTLAGGIELNLLPDAYVTTDAREDVSDWIGYGVTGSYKATDNLTINLRGAYRDSDDAQQYSIGPGIKYGNFYVSYLYGETDAAEDFQVSQYGDAKYHVAYASYKIPAILGSDNLDMYLGASWGDQDMDNVDSAEQLGARVRFKYFF